MKHFPSNCTSSTLSKIENKYQCGDTLTYFLVERVQRVSDGGQLQFLLLIPGIGADHAGEQVCHTEDALVLVCVQIEKAEEFLIFLKFHLLLQCFPVTGKI